jgi:glycosyl transferase family 25
MKTYAISLARSKERARYIKSHLTERQLDYTIINAIDGETLTSKDIEQCCDMEEVNKHPIWLSNGAIGCALSHLNAYREFLKTDEAAAFIVEDDVVLPSNINTILEEISRQLQESEVILLYCTSFRTAALSTIGRKEIQAGFLYYPIDMSQTITATAYVISRRAALNMCNHILPIKVTADSWHYYYDKKNCFDSLRVLYPLIIQTKNFKSSIDYLPKHTFKFILSDIVNRYKVPVLYSLAKYLRKRRLDNMLGNFVLTEEASPIQKKNAGTENSFKK